MSIEKLKEELSGMKASGLEDMHVSWGPGAKDMTPDERAAAVSDMLTEVRKWHALSDEEKMRVQIKQAYESLKSVIDQCKFTVDEYMREPSKESMRDLHSRISTLFGGIEGALLPLGNWVRNEDRAAIRKAAQESKDR